MCPNLKIKNMSLKFESNDRPDVGLQEKLLNEETPFTKIPFPKQIELPCVNYQEVLASDSYKKCIENFKKYTELDMPLNGINVMGLGGILMHDHTAITSIEHNHREELERLAVELVTKEMGVPEGSFNFDVKITEQEEITSDDFSHGEPPSTPEVDIDDDFVLPTNENLEKSKRRLVNAIIQGSSKRGHYMFHIVEDKLKEITGNDDIIKFYGRLMSVNDTLYWQLPYEMIKSLGGGDGGESSMAGKETVDRNTTPPTIFVRAINFPVLVHEIIKGIMEVFAIQGLPENYDSFKDEEDTMESEMWDLRLGPAIWGKLKSHFPIEIIIDDDKVELQNYLLVEIFKLPANDFLYFMREIFKDSEESKILIQNLMKKINHPDDVMEDDD